MKYELLGLRLALIKNSITDETIHISYEQIEQIIGDKLPDGTNPKDGYFWCSETEDTETPRSLSRVLREAGWRVWDPGWETRILELRRIRIRN
jgi:hypothetical protein